MLRKIYRFAIWPYTVALLYMMFFGFGRVMLDDNVVRLKPLISTVEFAKNSILWSRVPMFLVNFFGNIGMFVPFGFLGWVLPKFLQLKPLLIAFLSALIIIEALQYFTRMGVFDIDDIILNSVGLWIGFWLRNKIDRVFAK